MVGGCSSRSSGSLGGRRVEKDLQLNIGKSTGVFHGTSACPRALDEHAVDV